MAKITNWRPNEKWSYNFFKRPAACSTIIVMHGNDVLLMKRNVKTRAEPGKFAFPGGFINTDIETLEQCALRELEEETGLNGFEEISLKLLTVNSDPTSDPRAHVINAVYVLILDDDKPKPCITPDDDVVDYKWMCIREYASKPQAFKQEKLAKKYLEWREK
ncbi:hypothetical protein CMI47_13150 [Candidatus Pacearchaeota archaeon]|nr:hypothetical protein [Candidatus Pacearchaeota archaeon]|tara:strand:- start:523 stop:1008 length:486 start_codon:yes stop_codon:yes gene_type:complete